MMEFLMQPNLRQSDRLSVFASVATKLGLEPSFVQRVASGEVQSPAVDAALKSELDDLTQYFLSLRSQASSRSEGRREADQPHLQTTSS